MRYFHYDPKTGVINGTGSTPDGTYPANTVPCTEEQVSYWQDWVVDTRRKKPVLKRKEDK